MESLRKLKALWARAQQRRAVRWGIDLVLIGLVAFAAMTWQTRDHIGGGEPAPAFTLKDLDGKTWKLEDLRGKPVLIAFWAPWCGVCKTESSTISDLRKSVGDDAHVISIAASWDDLQEVKQYVRDQKVDYPVLLGNDRILREWKVNAFPTMYFVSEDGTIQRSTTGLTSELGLKWRLTL